MRTGVFSFQFSVFSQTAAVAGNAPECPRTNWGVSTYHPTKKTRWHLLQIVASAISAAGFNRRWTQMGAYPRARMDANPKTARMDTNAETHPSAARSGLKTEN